MGTGKAFFRHQGGHGDLDPLFARALVACCGAGCSCTAPTLWAHNPCARRNAGLAEAGDAAIGRVAQHAPHHRAFPATCFTSRYAFGVEATRDLPDAESFDCVHLIDAPYYTGLGFIDNIRGGHLVSLTDVTVSIGSAAHHAHLTGLRPVSLTATRTFQDLRSFIFSDHPLELHKKLIFRAVALWRLHEHRLDSVAGELLDHQNLVEAEEVVHAVDSRCARIISSGISTNVVDNRKINWSPYSRATAPTIRLNASRCVRASRA